MPSKVLKLSDDQVATIARALADPRRFAILQEISQVESMLCSGLTQHEAISPATVSHHLKELIEAGLIDSVREGRTMRLSLIRPAWAAYLKRLQAL